MIEKIITTFITFILSTTLGYLVSLLRTYKNDAKKRKENDLMQNEALKILLQTNLTNTYFVYQELGSIPDYMLKNWTNLFKIYKRLCGNDYVDTLKKHINDWEITRTNILSK